MAAGLGIAIPIFVDGSKAKENGKEGDGKIERRVATQNIQFLFSPKEILLVETEMNLTPTRGFSVRILGKPE